MSYSSLVDTRVSSEMTTPGIKPAETEERDRKLDESERTRVRPTRRTGGL